MTPATRANVLAATSTSADDQAIAEKYGVRVRDVMRLRQNGRMIQPKAGRAAVGEAENTLRSDSERAEAAIRSSGLLRDAVRSYWNMRLRRDRLPPFDWAGLDRRLGVGE